MTNSINSTEAPATDENNTPVVHPTELRFPEGFVDRRDNEDPNSAGRERRQFANSHEELSPEARELATAIDAYKLRHRRRFITYEEIYAVIVALGYRKDD